MAEGLDTMAALDAAGLADLRGMVIAAQDEFVRACGIHPEFPAGFCSVEMAALRLQLKTVRAINDGEGLTLRPTAHLVLVEEVGEMLEQVMLGDLEAARAECVQAAAVLLRIYVHLPEYCAAAVRAQTGEGAGGE